MLLAPARPALTVTRFMGAPAVVPVVADRVMHPAHLSVIDRGCTRLIAPKSDITDVARHCIPRTSRDAHGDTNCVATNTIWATRMIQPQVAPMRYRQANRTRFVFSSAGRFSLAALPTRLLVTPRTLHVFIADRTTFGAISTAWVATTPNGIAPIAANTIGSTSVGIANIAADDTIALRVLISRRDTLALALAFAASSARPPVMRNTYRYPYSAYVKKSNAGHRTPWPWASAMLPAWTMPDTCRNSSPDICRACRSGTRLRWPSASIRKPEILNRTTVTAAAYTTVVKP